MPIKEVKTPAKSLVGRAIKIALAALLLLLIAGIVAPFITMASYSGRIREALESALGRSVEFQKLHLTLFSGPGFLLNSVTIGEDPRYGLEAFAYVPTLEARLRLDKLLLGRIQFSSLRLIEPSLNLVKKNDGTWNVVSLVERLSSPRRVPLNLFPVIEISEGRLNFKLGVRKTTLYISESGLSIYPESSGKLYLRFSGSPARTDRAGNGFGHFHGTANWYLGPTAQNANQLEANLILDSSNLSEITTLFEGYDIGIHGSISSHLHIEGPANGLRLAGDLHLEDVHRWDLLPSSGEDWHIRYGGEIDLTARRLQIQTIPWHEKDRLPVAVQMQVSDFLRTNRWQLTTQLRRAPAQNLLPLAARMGLSFPENVTLQGTLDGVVSYSGPGELSGNVTINNLLTIVPQAQPLTAAAADIEISKDRFRLRPTVLQTPSGEALEASGEYVPETRKVTADIHVKNVSTDMLKSETLAWFGEYPMHDIVSGGELSGYLSYRHEESEPAQWKGQLQFIEATMSPAGLNTTLKHAAGRFTFKASDFQVDDFSAMLLNRSIRGNYRHSEGATPPERLRLQIPSLDLSQAAGLLRPSLETRDLWTRLHLGRYRAPDWLVGRNLDGGVDIAQLSMDGTALGSIKSHFLWKGTGVEFTSFTLNLPEGSLQGQGNVNLSENSPSYRFTSSIFSFPYKGGLLNAEGKWQSSGTGADALLNFRATGTFAGEDLALSERDVFDRLSGAFKLSFAKGLPDLRLSDVEASANDENWTGEAISGGNGTIVFSIHNEVNERRVTTSLISGEPTLPSAQPDNESQ